MIRSAFILGLGFLQGSVMLRQKKQKTIPENADVLSIVC